MPSANKWEHFDSEIERMLSTVSGLTVLPMFNIAEWSSSKYKFPYAHVQLMDYEYAFARAEDRQPIANLTSEQRFIIYIGIDSTTDTDGKKYLRKAEGALKDSIEKAAVDFTFADYTNSDYKIIIDSFIIEAGSPAASSGATKRLTAIGGVIEYRQIWT